LNATVGAYFAATGTTGDLTAANIADPKNQAYIRDLEHSIVHYGDTTLTFLTALQRADDAGRALSYISAVTVEEDSVWAYNQGDPTGDPALLHQHAKPRTPLVAIYPAEGTIYSDHPFVPLTWMDAQKRKAADDFLTYLHSSSVQAGFQQFGYRDRQEHAGSEISAANGLDPRQPRTTLTLPSANGLSSMLDAWAGLRKPARVLFAVDRSGSMLDMVPGTGRTKADLAKSAATSAMDYFGTQDEVGLWMFAARLKGEQDWLELQPVAPMDAAHRAALKQSLHDLTVDGGTGLYDTTYDAFSAVKNGSTAGTIQAVVVLTDGMNERTGGLDLETLVSRLGHQTGEPVRVFTVAYGADADKAVLQKIAQATDAAEYDSADPNSIQEVLTEVVSNF
jgi:Ca-activated chloride channel family protein